MQDGGTFGHTRDQETVKAKELSEPGHGITDVAVLKRRELENGRCLLTEALKDYNVTY